MSWKDTSSAFTPDFVEHEVSGRKLRFYPVTLRCAFQLRALAGPLASALTTLFEGRNDSGSKHMEYGQPSEDNTMREFGKETVINAVSLDVIKFRSSARQQAVQTLVNTLTEQSSQRVLGRLVMDSMRDEFPKGSTFKDSDVDEFTENLDVPVFAQMLVGVGKANAGVLGPLAPKVSKRLKSRLDEALSETPDPPETDNNDNNDNPIQETESLFDEASASKRGATG